MLNLLRQKQEWDISIIKFDIANAFERSYKRMITLWSSIRHASKTSTLLKFLLIMGYGMWYVM